METFHYRISSEVEWKTIEAASPEDAAERAMEKEIQPGTVAASLEIWIQGEGKNSTPPCGVPFLVTGRQRFIARAVRMS